MKTLRKPGLPEAIRFGLLELLVVLVGLTFVRKEVYLHAKFSSMILHWQEYALLVLMFADGVFRGFGEIQGQARYASPFRKKYLRFLLPATLFLFVSCSSLCDKLNVMCIHDEWWRDIGVVFLAAGVFLSAWSHLNRPKGLEAAIPAPKNELESVAEDERKIDAAASNTDAAASNAAAASSKTGDAEAMKKTEGESADLDATTSDSSTPDSSISDSEEVSIEKQKSEIDQTPESEQEPEDIFADKEDIKTTGPWSLLRYPGRTALLLELVGISMTLSAWLPLLTLPGLVVMFKWELSDVEEFRISQFGQKYLRYKEKSWLLIPYLY
jgi:protein-S-isoprenylcysteine O-methyltransferase Ste14